MPNIVKADCGFDPHDMNAIRKYLLKLLKLKMVLI